jgi:thiol-disulfide isomerase/thioredoxin
MAVAVLGDGDAVSKFRSVNPKSVMYFTATWCPPCKMISPIYTALSETYPDVAFGKIDIDDNQESATEYKISAVPTFVFSRGKVESRFSGADKAQLEKLVKELTEE